MRDTIADTNFSISISICISTTLQYKEEKCLICKEIKNREIFLHASSLEKHIKAILPIFGAILALSAFMSKKAKSLDNNKQMEISKALINIILIPFNKDEVKKISHQPVSKSKLVELISLTKEFLPDELKKIYDEILNYINKPYNKRRYDELRKIIEEINNTFASLRWGDHFEKFVTDKMFKRLYKDVLEKIVYMNYLELAAGSVPRYSWGRSKDDEEYLRDVRGHEKDILKFLEKKTRIERLSNNYLELNDNLDRIPEIVFEFVFEYIMYFMMAPLFHKLYSMKKFVFSTQKTKRFILKGEDIKLPKAVTEEVGIKDSDEVVIEIRKDKIIISKVNNEIAKKF